MLGGDGALEEVLHHRIPPAGRLAHAVAVIAAVNEEIALLADHILDNAVLAEAVVNRGGAGRAPYLALCEVSGKEGKASAFEVLFFAGFVK